MYLSSKYSTLSYPLASTKPSSLHEWLLRIVVCEVKPHRLVTIALNVFLLGKSKQTYGKYSAYEVDATAQEGSLHVLSPKQKNAGFFICAPQFCFCREQHNVFLVSYTFEDQPLHKKIVAIFGAKYRQGVQHRLCLRLALCFSLSKFTVFCFVSSRDGQRPAGVRCGSCTK